MSLKASSSKPLNRPLPEHRAGVVITVPLERYPEYLEKNSLAPDRVKIGILYLKRREEGHEIRTGARYR